MKYYNTIISLFFLSIFLILLLLYFANITRNIEKENYSLKKKINYIEDQININEIEYSLYNSYEYLVKLQKIYFNESINIKDNQRISFDNLKNKNIEYFHTVVLNNTK